MAFNVKFYNFNKKENSTKIPNSNAGSNFSCILKEPSGILNPTISLNIGLANNPSQYNYCYIDTFNRYYYVTEWTFENALWYASLSVDVLGTYKNAIGDADLYILRSSAESDGRVVDSKYPTKTKPSTYIDDISTVTTSKVDGTLPSSMPNYWSTPINNGYYYLGITGNNSTGVTWYVMTPGGFNTLAQALYNYVPSDMTDVSSGIAKAFANPMQFIVSCYWLPYVVPGKLIANRTLNLGYYSIPNVSCAPIDPVSDIVKSSATFTIRKHPQASSRGVYLNTNPYTNYSIQFNPFGTFNLDASLMVDDTLITAEWYVDISTGIADLTIKSINSLLVNTQSQLGIPVQLNQALVDYIGMASNQVQAGLGVVGGTIQALSGDIRGLSTLASSVVGGYVGATESKQPKITSIGGGGNFLPFNSYIPKIYTDFYEIVDEFNYEIGRPLCKVRKPKNIPGYMIVLDGTLEASATRDELQQVNNYLMGGFFYE